MKHLKNISGWRYTPETIINKDGLCFLIWQTTKLVDKKFVEYLGVFKDKQEVKNHFPHASMLDYNDSRLSNDRKRLVDLIIQYWDFQRNPTIEQNKSKRDYPISDDEIAPDFISTNVRMKIQPIDREIIINNPVKDCKNNQGNEP